MCQSAQYSINTSINKSIYMYSIAMYNTYTLFETRGYFMCHRQTFLKGTYSELRQDKELRALIEKTSGGLFTYPGKTDKQYLVFNDEKSYQSCLSQLPEQNYQQVDDSHPLGDYRISDQKNTIEITDTSRLLQNRVVRLATPAEIFKRHYEASDQKLAFRVRFCAAAREALSDFPSEPRAQEFWELFLRCDSDEALLNIMHGIFAQLDRYKKYPFLSESQEFNDLLSKILHEYKSVHCKDPTAYDSLSKLKKGATQRDGHIEGGEIIDTDHYQGTPSEHFVYFRAKVCNLEGHNTAKLRISVDAKQIATAWNCVKDLFLAANSPLKIFKMTIFDKNKPSDRLHDGGQITISLPENPDYDAISQFLNKVVEKLNEKNILPGKIPASDLPLNGYISGRVDTVDGRYVAASTLSKEKSYAMNSENPVLQKFKEKISKNLEQKENVSNEGDQKDPISKHNSKGVTPVASEIAAGGSAPPSGVTASGEAEAGGAAPPSGVGVTASGGVAAGGSGVIASSNSASLLLFSPSNSKAPRPKKLKRKRRVKQRLRMN